MAVAVALRRASQQRRAGVLFSTSVATADWVFVAASRAGRRERSRRSERFFAKFLTGVPRGTA